MTTHLLASDLSITPTNTLSTILPKLKDLETKGKVLQVIYDLGSTTAPTTLSASSFNVPKYIKYVNYVDYTTFTHPIPMGNAFAMKISAYIKITNGGQYQLATNSTNDKIKVYINNYLILDNITTTTASTEIYLNSGTYLLYVEKIANVGNASLTLTLTPKTTTSNNTAISITDYVLINYRPIENALKSRDTAITNYCTTTTNLFSSDTTNLCNKSLTETDLLNTLLLNTCFPSANEISKNTALKLNDNCKTVYTRTSPSALNSSIKNNFNTKYKEWANNVVNANLIPSNKLALEEYLNDRTPNETDFPFHTNIQNYCENDSEVKKSYNVTTQNNNQFCKIAYNRTFTGNNKTLADRSIQQIKNNYCDPKLTVTNITSADCVYEYKNKPDLKDSISSYCFIPNNAGGTDIKKNSLDKKYDTNCRNIHRTPDLNSTIKTELDTKYQNWATNIITNSANTDDTFATHDAALNEYIVDKGVTSSSQVFGTNNTVTPALINYCEKQISPTNNKFMADNNTNTLCNTIYNHNSLKTLPNIQNSINKLKTNYCTVKDANGKYRYELNDPQCNPELTGLLSQTVLDRCNPNNSFNNSDSWCVSQSDDNINNNNSPYSNMRTSRINALKSEASSLEVKDYLNKKILNDANYKFATGSYSRITDSNIKKLSDTLLTNQLFQYCENKEPEYPSDSTSQCKGIYDLYKTNSAVIDSRNKIRDQLCKLPKNITTDIVDDYTNNAYKCKTTVFNTSNNIDKFGPTVNDYCNTGDNIATSDNCKAYYNDIENKILNSLNYQISDAPKSSFSNKFYQTNDLVEDYNKKFELSTFENNDQSGDSDSDNVLTPPPIYYLQTDSECHSNHSHHPEHNQSDDSMLLSFLLFFIFIMLIVGLFSSCMYNNKKPTTTNINNSLPASSSVQK